MTIEPGARLPDAPLTTIGRDGPQIVRLHDRLAGRRVVLFALPGAFTRGCTATHMPSFVRTADAFREKGADEVICLAVNDPFVLNAWGHETGAHEAGITLLGDPEGTFTRAVGMEFSAPQIGLIGRSNRYALVADDAIVKTAQIDEPGACSLSTGESLLATL